MRAALVVCGLAACWTGSTAVPETRVERPKQCTIRETDAEIAGMAQLSVEGLPFALQPGPFRRFDVTFHDAIGRAHLETASLALDGDLDLGEVTLRPRGGKPRERWVDIRTGTAREATGDALKVEVSLPDGIAPKSLTFVLPCRDLTFTPPPDAADEAELEQVSLPVHTQLRPSPDGPVVARVVGRIDPDDRAGGPIAIDATVIGRRGSMTQLRIDGTNPVTVWASSLALQPAIGDGGGGFGYGRSGYTQPSSTCSRDVPIHVRVRGRVVRVGRIKKGASFFTTGDGDGDDVPIDLGLREPALQPAISAADFAACE